jgi:hypothetical protein
LVLIVVPTTAALLPRIVLPGVLALLPRISIAAALLTGIVLLIGSIAALVLVLVSHVQFLSSMDTF